MIRKYNDNIPNCLMVRLDCAKMEVMVHGSRFVNNPFSYAYKEKCCVAIRQCRGRGSVQIREARTDSLLSAAKPTNAL